MICSKSKQTNPAVLILVPPQLSIRSCILPLSLIFCSMNRIYFVVLVSAIHFGRFSAPPLQVLLVAFSPGVAPRWPPVIAPQLSGFVAPFFHPMLQSEKFLFRSLAHWCFPGCAQCTNEPFRGTLHFSSVFFISKISLELFLDVTNLFLCSLFYQSPGLTEILYPETPKPLLCLTLVLRFVLFICIFSWPFKTYASC